MVPACGVCVLEGVVCGVECVLGVGICECGAVLGMECGYAVVGFVF
jgi:hypothetical protein